MNQPATYTRRRRRRGRGCLPGMLVFVLLLATVAYLAISGGVNILPGNKVYSAEDFGIETLTSSADADGDGVDDYTDIMLAARAYINTKPTYDGTYYEGGYPPEGIGVCTDVIWRAFDGAGYDLKSIVDADIAANPESYTSIDIPDPNIDFRRVSTLRVFFQRYAQSLTTDTSQISDWQPGDIVVFADHIGIISDKRNSDGIPYIIHHGKNPAVEADDLLNEPVMAHFRWSM